MHEVKQYSILFETTLKGEWVDTLAEIGLDEIETATSFVDYMNERYGESKSSVWYRLKRMKELGFVEFMEKGEEARPLSLTRKGIELVRKRMTSSDSMAKEAFRGVAMRMSAPF